MYHALVSVGSLCALLIVSVFEGTKPYIAKNRAEALERAIFSVLPGAVASRTFVFTGDTFVEDAQAKGDRVYAAYGSEGNLLGVAFEARGMGYADLISVLYGYAFDRSAIVGLEVLESKETPGLGDKIEKDPESRANFEALLVVLDDEGAVANPISTVPNGTKRLPWEIDGITGATISSKALGEMLRESTAKWAPLLEAHRRSLEKETANDG